MDYRTNGMGAALQRECKKAIGYGVLAAPGWQAILLNLEAESRRPAAVARGSVLVTYGFRDGSSVVIRMERPFGADGIRCPRVERRGGSSG